ncbi:putative Iron transporter [Pseudohyphozyma bogoriensis]|nr:putative Iron transporter [Pseudohyphozyma bogoriensis]
MGHSSNLIAVSTAGSTVFSVPIFFIVLRETIESAIIVSVLLSLVENLIDKDTTLQTPSADDGDHEDLEAASARRARLARRMKLQIWAGTASGFVLAFCLGAAFLAVFFTTLKDLWAASEEIWEGVFNIIAWGITMMKIDRSKIKWQLILAEAFADKPESESTGTKPTWFQKLFRRKRHSGPLTADEKRGRSGKWTLFVLPFVTLLHLIYISGSRVNLSIFLVVSTNILFLLGAGLLSKAVGNFQRFIYNSGVGKDTAELGSGPGSYDVYGSVWHLEYGNPQDVLTPGGWGVFYAVLGWSNDGTIGTILAYCFYWLLVAGSFVYLKWSEGRATFFGIESSAGKRRRERLAAKASGPASSKSDADVAGAHDTKVSQSTALPVLA